MLQSPLTGTRFVRAGTEILYGEVDRVGDHFEHRPLLWPPEFGSFEVGFDDVDVASVRFREADVSLVTHGK